MMVCWNETIKQYYRISTIQRQLVGGFNHPENISQLGRIIPYIMENNKNVPNHQTKTSNIIW